ncbi:hypothetical protein JOF53_000189 [Crossiella equi]|uniref:Winged helix DNA-binding domain-containing protein n=1 Tax=Crossiella equi TaxID=130796 RepID=A0ABS5A4Z4_9PSEU|nr:winged helix DNA-binding domain-containing protein [Crossiella equi]MBP2471317.1 hypothetical protein [Crossiella equi]
MPEMDWKQVCAVRMRRHALTTPRTDLAEIAEAMCGVHAQIITAAELSLGLRHPAATRADVRRALWQDHTLVKTFGLRGTVHLLATADLPLWTGALATMPSTAVYPPAVRLSPGQTDEVVAALDEVLRTGEHTLAELTPEVVARTGDWAGELVVPAFNGFWPRWAQLLAPAAYRGVLCFGADRDRKTTYTSPLRWGARPALEPAVAQAELLRRYLHAYGPATPAHFAQWLSTTRTWADQLFQANRDRLRPVRLHGVDCWLNADDPFTADEPAPGLCLLPYFDAYSVGCHPRDLVFPGKANQRALKRGQAGAYPVVLVDGVVAGVWHQRRSGRRLVVTVEPCGRWPAGRRRLLAEQVERAAAVLEGVPELTVGEVTVGPHA